MIFFATTSESEWNFGKLISNAEGTAINENSVVDRTFKTDDIFWKVEMRLVGNTLHWKHDYESDSKYKSIDISEPDTLEYVGFGLLRDSSRFYSIGYITELEGGAKLSQLNPTATTIPIKDPGTDGYLVNGSDVYALVTEMSLPWLVRIQGADSATFNALEHGYSSDLGGVYFGGKIVAGAKPDEFSFLPTNQLVFGKTSQTLYFKGKPLTGLNVKNVQFLRDSTVVTDGNVYYYLKGNCHFTDFELGTEAELETYKGVC